MGLFQSKVVGSGSILKECGGKGGKKGGGRKEEGTFNIYEKIRGYGDNRGLVRGMKNIISIPFKVVCVLGFVYFYLFWKILIYFIISFPFNT